MCTTQFPGSGLDGKVETGISVGITLFAGLKVVTNAQTDHATPSVAIGRQKVGLCRIFVSCSIRLRIVGKQCILIRPNSANAMVQPYQKYIFSVFFVKYPAYVLYE